MKKASLLMAC